MMITCTTSSIADLLKPQGKRPPKLKLAEVPRYFREELGLHGMNLSTDLLTGSTRERLAALRDQADKSGCACLMLFEPEALPLGVASDDAASEHLDRIRRVTEAGHLLGCNAVGIRIDAKDDDDTFERVTTRLRAAMEHAERLELNLLVNPQKGLTESPERLTELIKKVGGFRVGTLPDFKAAVDSGDAETYLRRITPYASVVLATTYEFGEAPESEPADDEPGSLEALADMLMASEAAPHETFDLKPLLAAIGAVGFDGTLAIDYRGKEEGTLGVLKSKEALEAAMEELADAS